MQFTRIRLSGFKSFVEPTELLIEPGLTGVVGPNGCGKSNLLEAIRWVMGESSAKSMRGSGMDDIIFAGTERRPPRNIADVTLCLDNTSRNAPAAFNDSEEIEVSRRIERESGSAYRINSAEVRAKDVQLLFADAATGARSPALVSQGSIGSVINAKPQNRRMILEEAAGVMGLQTRRKEAESRLRAAENNLLRLDDVMVQMEGQMVALKRQARQATRFRNISGDLRRAEATHLYLKWRTAADALLIHEAELQGAQIQVSEITRVATQMTTEQTKLSAVLPELRQKEAERAAAVHRLTVASENLNAEEVRLREQKAELESRLNLIAIDRSREVEFQSDAKSALSGFDEETAALSKGDGDEAARESEAARGLEIAHGKASEAEARYDAISSRLAAERAQGESLGLDRETAIARAERLTTELADIRKKRAALDDGDEQSLKIQDAEAAVAEAEKTLQMVQDELSGIEAARLEAQEIREAAREALAEQKNALGAIAAEIRALDDVLSSGRQDGETAIADSIKVDSGYEVALGTALGDDLNAPEGDTSKLGWRALPPLSPDQPLPAGAEPLANFVKGPKALARRLSQVGVVAGTEGPKLSAELRPGQRLVTRDGALWRWDGYFSGADAPTAQATRMAQKNRRKALEGDQAKATKLVDEARAALERAEADVEVAAAEERAQRARRGQAERDQDSARTEMNRLTQSGSKRLSDLGALAEAESRTKKDLEETRERLGRTEAALSELPATDATEAEYDDARKEVETLRSQLAEARATYDSLHRVGVERAARLESIDAERSAWTGRLERAEAQVGELDKREAEARRRLAEVADNPAEIEQRRTALLDQIGKAEATRDRAADALARAETLLAEKDRELKAAQGQLADIRETRIRAEAACENAEERQSAIAHDIAEKFECAPTAVLDAAGVKEKDQENLPEPEFVERRLDRLRAERERLGAVNMRADQELQELTEQVGHLESEKADLTSAIARLRHGMASLNREGQERVLAAFTEVNGHFGRLFTTLFGGGEAHLELTQSDDPLEVGLEIMGSPPGKKLQSLSLMSGGEQALTAIALIFAVFMTNPAPICVLDEVDAPLDDANVERFCDLLDTIEAETGTRFLIVTHNAVTMSRMNRLFGVTMAERGVSQLVSVDLERAEELRAVS